MNGVRRFLTAATTTPGPSSTTPSPTTPSESRPFAGGPSWSPQVVTNSQSSSQPAQSLVKRDQNRQKQQPPTPPPEDDLRPSNHHSVPSTSTSTASTSRLPSNRATKRKSPPHAQSFPEVDWQRATAKNAPHNTAQNVVRNELLIDLLASQALVDSRDLEILTSEQVDEFKKEYQVLTSRLEAISKKLTVETKIRDAAASLSKVNAAHKRVSKQSEEQLEVASRRVEATQKEYWRISERAYEVDKKLMDHRAGVLSVSLRSIEQRAGANGVTSNGLPSDDSGYGSSNCTTLMSPTSSTITSSSSASSKARFEGPHLFAGHVDAVVPKPQRHREDAASEIAALETKLKAATDALAAAGKKQAELTRELSVIRLEKQEVEVLMGMDLQTAEEKISALEEQVRSGMDNREANNTTVLKPSDLSDSVERILHVLIPIWNILPSPEARAAKFSHNRQFRPGAPSSPMLTATLQLSPGNTNKNVVSSLSELDVRSLKSLYESTRGVGANGQPPSPGVGGEFSIEAFASRVQALIQDDRALIERLVRFAQAHDLLKKNAERAQKLAQEGNNALETYQKQVRTLEDRNTQLAARLTVLQDEVQEFQSGVGPNKQELEAVIAQQTKSCKELKEANDILSARASALAKEASSASDVMRKQIEAKLAAARSETEAVRAEMEEMRSSEQTQRIALMDLLNSTQTENAELREKLRARK